MSRRHPVDICCVLEYAVQCEVECYIQMLVVFDSLLNGTTAAGIDICCVLEYTVQCDAECSVQMPVVFDSLLHARVCCSVCCSVPVCVAVCAAVCCRVLYILYIDARSV